MAVDKAAFRAATVGGATLWRQWVLVASTSCGFQRMGRISDIDIVVMSFVLCIRSAMKDRWESVKLGYDAAQAMASAEAVRENDLAVDPACVLVPSVAVGTYYVVVLATGHRVIDMGGKADIVVYDERDNISIVASLLVIARAGIGIFEDYTIMT